MKLLPTLLTLLTAGLINLLSSEIYVSLDRWSLAIVRWAARHMSPNLRDRFEEEWSGVMAEMPGNLAKLWFALGCCVAALRTPRSAAEAVPDDNGPSREVLRHLLGTYALAAAQGVYPNDRTKVLMGILWFFVLRTVGTEEALILSEKEWEELLGKELSSNEIEALSAATFVPEDRSLFFCAKMTRRLVHMHHYGSAPYVSEASND